MTKQRMESHFDLELRAAVMHDILDMMPEGEEGWWLKRTDMLLLPCVHVATFARAQNVAMAYRGYEQ